VLQTVTHAQDRVGALDWHPDGERLVLTDGEKGGGNDNVYIHDVDANTLVSTITAASGGGVRAAQWSPDGQYLAFGDESKDVFVVDADTQATVLTGTVATQRSGGIVSLGWDAASERVAAGREGGADDFAVFKVGVGKILAGDFSGSTFEEGSGIALAQDGSRVAVASPNSAEIQVFNVATGGLVTGVSADRYYALQRHPTQNRLAAVGDAGADIYAVTNTGLVQTAALAGFEGRDGDWSHNGEYIATVDSGDTQSKPPINDATRWRVFVAQPVVKGTVSDANGNPVSGVTVELAHAASASTRCRPTAAAGTRSSPTNRARST
jgi:FOG: WD40 repeat